MQTTRVVEVWVGVFVALGFVAILFVALQVSNLGEFRSAQDSYVVKAWFGNVGGLRPRAQVSMAGVTVGRVESISFDGKRYEALVRMRIDPAYKTLPEDTSASILTAGLLGEQYVGLTAGGSEDFLKDGDEIELTQSAVILEQLISRFLFNKAEEGKGDKKAAADVSASPVSAQSALAQDAASNTPAPETESSPKTMVQPQRKTPAVIRQELVKASKKGSGEPVSAKAKKGATVKTDTARPKPTH